jgi:hypothetical protein
MVHGSTNVSDFSNLDNALAGLPSGVPLHPHPTSSSDISRSATVTDLDNMHKGDKTSVYSPDGKGVPLPAESTLGEVERLRLEKGEVVHEDKVNVLASLPNARKNILMLCFCLSMFM